MLRAVLGPRKTTGSSAVPIMNQLLISRDWTTWPLSRALARRRCEGSSVFWLWSTSSATSQAPVRRARSAAKRSTNHCKPLDSSKAKAARPATICSGWITKRICICGARREIRPTAT